jgi:hypothetical protein
LPAKRDIDRQLADLERKMDELEASEEDHRVHRREMTIEEIIDLFVVLGEIAVVNQLPYATLLSQWLRLDPEDAEELAETFWPRVEAKVRGTSRGYAG